MIVKKECFFCRIGLHVFDEPRWDTRVCRKCGLTQYWSTPLPYSNDDGWHPTKEESDRFDKILEEQKKSVANEEMKK